MSSTRPFPLRTTPSRLRSRTARLLRPAVGRARQHPGAAAAAAAAAAATAATIAAARPGWVELDPKLGEHAVRMLLVALPVLGVMVARVADVTLGVLRTVFVVSGRRTAAGALAAAESGVWLAAAGVVLSDLTPAKGVAYCVGVGVGTVVGMALVRAAKWGVVTVRVFAPRGHGEEIAAAIRARGLGATVFDCRGKDGPRDMVMSIARRREAAQLSGDLANRDDVFCVVDSDAVVGTIGGTTGRA